jgi:hypothetical protein
MRIIHLYIYIKIIVVVVVVVVIGTQISKEKKPTN